MNKRAISANADGQGGSEDLFNKQILFNPK